VNGKDGLSLFPVTRSISYVIRDNAWCCERMPRSKSKFDVFVVLGDNPTQYEFKRCFYFIGAQSYQEACDLIDVACANVIGLQTKIRQE
jgi:hypothetical protein